jgi:hypothetical protein
VPPKRRYPLSTQCHILEDNNTKSPDDDIYPAPCIMSVTPRRASVIYARLVMPRHDILVHIRLL